MADVSTSPEHWRQTLKKGFPNPDLKSGIYSSQPVRLSELSVVLCTERLSVQFPVWAHARVASLVHGWGTYGRQPTDQCFFLTSLCLFLLSPSLACPQVRIKKIIIIIKEVSDFTVNNTWGTAPLGPKATLSDLDHQQAFDGLEEETSPVSVSLRPDRQKPPSKGKCEKRGTLHKPWWKTWINVRFSLSIWLFRDLLLLSCVKSIVTLCAGEV